MPEEELELEKDEFYAVSSETRAAILKLLEEKRMTVTDIAKQLKLSKSTVHEHLQKMLDAGILKKDDARKWVYYSPSNRGQKMLSAKSFRIKVAQFFCVGIGATVVLAAVLYVMVGGLLTEQSALVTGDGMKKDVTNSTAGIDIVVIGGGDKAIAEFSAYLISGSSAVVSMPAVSTTAVTEGGITLNFNDLNSDGFLTGIDSFTFTGLAPDTDYTFTLEYSGQEVFTEDFTTLM